uniref:Uncharacterized protein n=1 Tax=Panagrolaimus davidi TaxID=227884 RepID=A0A914QUX0_9BILA
MHCFSAFYVIVLIILIYVYSTAEPNEIKEAKMRMGIETVSMGNESNNILIIVVAILYIIFKLSFTAWFIWVIFLCYRYFRDLKNFRGRTFIGREPFFFDS